MIGKGFMNRVGLAVLCIIIMVGLRCVLGLCACLLAIPYLHVYKRSVTNEEYPGLISGGDFCCFILSHS